jgi:hypothetical protein
MIPPDLAKSRIGGYLRFFGKGKGEENAELRMQNAEWGANRLRANCKNLSNPNNYFMERFLGRLFAKRRKSPPLLFAKRRKKGRPMVSRI